MKKGEHTPGPWKYGPADDGYLYVYDADGHAICQIGMADGVFANARLITAAPDLLAACEWSLSMMAGGRPEEDIAHLRAAIKKARGTP